MTKSFEQMLYLFGENACGIKADIGEEANTNEILSLAQSQGVWTMIYPQLAKRYGLPECRGEFFATIARSIAKRMFTLGIIKELEENGVSCCLLKGVTVAYLYAEPDCRVSGDTDILIEPKKEKFVSEFLIKKGYILSKRQKNDHHLKAYHTNGGLLEVHVKLDSYVSSKYIFSGTKLYKEPYSKLEIDGYKYTVLGVNDTLMYLTAHYIRHFVNSGGGVRQMMDLVLYIDKNKDKIDFDSYNEILKELRYDGLIDSVYYIANKYFGFSFEVKNNNEDLAGRLLTDCENGGIFGQSREELGSYKEYCYRRSGISKNTLRIFLLFKSETGIISRFLLPQERLISEYGFSYARYKVLLPVAWIHRLFTISKRKKQRNVSSGASKGVVNERMKLMKDLGMID